MKTGETTNEYGTSVSIHTCDTCGEEFTLCAAAPDDSKDWDNCLGDHCASYDPGRDVDILFMTDEEIAREKPVVCIKMLEKRRKFKRGELKL